jgi:NitT/TauT family transport system ATP-binding protein
MKSALDSKSDHKMPLEFFHDILDEHFTETDVVEQIETALNWGRYAGIFSYDRESNTLRLHQANERANEDIRPHG